MKCDNNCELVDLSIGIVPDTESEPVAPDVEYFDHHEGAARLAGFLKDLDISDVEAEDFPDGMGLSSEEISLTTHTGTHLDAPWHYGPEVQGEPSKTIEEIPLEWCCGNAVVLDLTSKDAREEILAHEIAEALDDIGHELSEGDIVLIETGSDKLWGTSEYLTEFPGMSEEATKYLVSRGVKVVGIDAYGFDKPFDEMGRRYKETRDSAELWPAHFAGREYEYCQIEKLANLDQLPRRKDIFLVTFPIEISDASGGWVRPVAFV